MAIYPVPRTSHNNRVARLRVSDCVLKQLVARSIPAWMLCFFKGQTVSCGRDRLAIYPVPKVAYNKRVARLRARELCAEAKGCGVDPCVDAPFFLWQRSRSGKRAP